MKTKQVKMDVLGCAALMAKRDFLKRNPQATEEEATEYACRNWEPWVEKALDAVALLYAYREKVAAPNN